MSEEHRSYPVVQFLLAALASRLDPAKEQSLFRSWAPTNFTNTIREPLCHVNETANVIIAIEVADAQASVFLFDLHNCHLGGFQIINPALDF